MSPELCTTLWPLRVAQRSGYRSFVEIVLVYLFVYLVYFPPQEGERGFKSLPQQRDPSEKFQRLEKRRENFPTVGKERGCVRGWCL
jgi:hypothetical protein